MLAYRRFAALLVLIVAPVCLALSCVWGIVTDSETGNPISGATLTFHDAQGNSGTAVTNQNGLYAFNIDNLPLPPPGTVSFGVSAPGYEPMTEQRQIGYDDGLFTDVQHFALTSAPAFSVRPIIIVPSDVTFLPNDSKVLDAVDGAMKELQRWLEEKSGGYTFTPAQAQIIHSSQPDQWFKVDPNGSHVSQSWSKVEEILAESGFEALCPYGFINVVWVATESEGGFNGGTRCGDMIDHQPDWPATTGPSNAGVATFGEWNLDALLGNDEQCSRESEWGPGVCGRRHQLGVLMHEMLHGFGMNHTCADDQWGDELTPEECDDLIMDNPGSYPEGGFIAQEREVLRHSPFMTAVQP